MNFRPVLAPVLSAVLFATLVLGLFAHATAAPFAYVGNTGGQVPTHDFSVIDTASNSVVATVPYAPEIGWGLSVFVGVAVSPDGSRVYVAPGAGAGAVSWLSTLPPTR